jgi:NADH-quinone oxidoreductase subunit M
MIIVWLLAITVLGGLLAWWYDRHLNQTLCRWIALLTLFVDLALLIWHYFATTGIIAVGQTYPWIPQFGISFTVRMDGLSLLFVFLTVFLGIISVVVSWTQISERVGFFHFNLMLILAGIIGVFTSFDLFLFYFFWELMLVPMYFLISIWGHENRTYAAIKFFIFTQASGLFMLLAILGLYFIHGQATGIYSFNYFELLGTNLSSTTGMWLMLGFIIAFAVKLPAVPVHTWLPDAHTQAPTAGSVILAGLLLKTGGYGFIRFVIPLFPASSVEISPVVMIIAVIGIIYGAILAFAQTDLKRLVAYTSISHLGFALLGIFAWNSLALQGAVIVMLAHGLSTGALFALVGMLDERLHSRDMSRMGGLWTVMPRMGGVGMFFAMASLGLPGLANFVGEFLVLLGTYRVSPVLTILAALGFVVSTIYSLWIVQRVFHGECRFEKGQLRDLDIREAAIFAPMMVGLLWLGVYPQPVLNTAKPAIETLQQSVSPKAIVDSPNIGDKP